MANTNRSCDMVITIAEYWLQQKWPIIPCRRRPWEQLPRLAAVGAAAETGGRGSSCRDWRPWEQLPRLAAASATDRAPAPAEHAVSWCRRSPKTRDNDHRTSYPHYLATAVIWPHYLATVVNLTTLPGHHLSWRLSTAEPS